MKGLFWRMCCRTMQWKKNVPDYQVVVLMSTEMRLVWSRVMSVLITFVGTRLFRDVVGVA